MERVYRVGATTMRVPMTEEEIARHEPPKEQVKPKRKRRVYDEPAISDATNGKAGRTGTD